MVTDVVTLSDVTEDKLLTLTAAVETGSHHPLAQAIVRYAQERGVSYIQAQDRRALAGVGVQGNVNGSEVLISSPAKLKEGILSVGHQQRVLQLEEQGKPSSSHCKTTSPSV